MGWLLAMLLAHLQVLFKPCPPRTAKKGWSQSNIIMLVTASHDCRRGFWGDEAWWFPQLSHSLNGCSKLVVLLRRVVVPRGRRRHHTAAEYLSVVMIVWVLNKPIFVGCCFNSSFTFKSCCSIFSGKINKLWNWPKFKKRNRLDSVILSPVAKRNRAAKWSHLEQPIKLTCKSERSAEQLAKSLPASSHQAMLFLAEVYPRSWAQIAHCLVINKFRACFFLLRLIRPIAKLCRTQVDVL